MKKIINLLAVPALALLASAAVWSAVGSIPQDKNEAPVEQIVEKSPFQNVSLTAKSAYVYDVRTRDVLYAKNEDLRLPLASVTKVMTALVASEIGATGSTVMVRDHALAVTGDSGLYKDERWLLRDLLDFSLTSSSNDGMQAIATSLGAFSRLEATPEEREEDFIRQMNDKAESLGMKNTYFFNATGLDQSEIQGGAYGTAKDMALLFDHVLRYHPSLMEATKEREVVVASLDNNIHTAKNTGLNISRIPGIKASKTGFTDIAGGNLVIVFDPELGRPIVVAVLGSTATERFTDALALVEASMKAMTNETN